MTINVAAMPPRTAAQRHDRYAKAAAQADKDARRPRSQVQIFAIGDVTFNELETMMGLTLNQLSEALELHTGHHWSNVQLSRVGTGARAMTAEMRSSIESLIQLWRKGLLCRTTTLKTSPSPKDSAA